VLSPLKEIRAKRKRGRKRSLGGEGAGHPYDALSLPSPENRIEFTCVRRGLHKQEKKGWVRDEGDCRRAVKGRKAGRNAADKTLSICGDRRRLGRTFHPFPCPSLPLTRGIAPPRTDRRVSKNLFLCGRRSYQAHLRGGGFAGEMSIADNSISDFHPRMDGMREIAA